MHAHGPLEVVADVLHDLRLGRRREARNGNPASDAFLEFLQKLPDVEVVHAKVVAPSRKAVGFVDHEALDAALLERPYDRRRPKGFGRNVEKRGAAALNLFEGRLSFEQIDEPVDRDGGEDLLFLEIVDLVLHERLQGRKHHRETRRRAGRHEGGQLKSDRFAAARREDRKQRFARDGRRGRGFLQRLLVPLVDAKAVEAEIFLERRCEVRAATAVFALGIPAETPPQHLDDAVRFGIAVRKPERRGGKRRMFGFRNGDETENASKLYGMPFNEFLDRRGSAELSRKHPADLGSGIRKSLGLQAEESKNPANPGTSERSSTRMRRTSSGSLRQSSTRSISSRKEVSASASGLLRVPGSAGASFGRA